MISVLGQVGGRSGLMCSDVIEGILGNVIVVVRLALGSEVIENRSYHRINAHSALVCQAFQFLELCVGKFQDKRAHGYVPLMCFS